MDESYGLFIDGTWTPAVDRQTYNITDPATGAVVGVCADAGVEDVLRAIDAADRAFSGWAKTTAKERAEWLRKVYEGMRRLEEELAQVMTREQGKPLAESRAEVRYAADFVEWSAEEAKRIYGETIPASSLDKRIWVHRQPVGVTAAITPWNFPASMITRKIAPALAAGCTVVVKPAQQTPLTACRIMDLFQEAGLPDGVVNLVTGTDSAAIGDVLLNHERVRKISFTGSTEVGKILMRKAADTVKKISLELGGHAPFIVFEDADLERAAEQVSASKFRNAGQTCVCANRIYVHESIADPFTRLLGAIAARLKVGNGLEEGVQIGPLIDQGAVDKVEAHVQDALEKGASLVVGGKRYSKGDVHFFEPTVLADVTDDMRIQREETFGPVAPIQTFRTDEEAIAKANDSRYGLAAYFYTRDLSRAVRVAEALEFGIVGVNDGVPSTAQAPFGGMKESGLGREGGRYGVEEFLETKYISLGLK